MKIRLAKNVAFAFLAGALLLSLPTGGFAADNVVSADIKEADGTSGQITNDGAGVKTGHIQDAAVTAPKLATGSVATDKIADGAVTDAKISGTISTSKLNVGTTAGTVAAGDHSHDGIYQKKYANVKVVSLDGNGDFTSPVDALNSITDASATNPYLVKIMPGVYSVSPFGGKNFVDVEGSGPGVTILRANFDTPNGLFGLASDAEIRDLAFELGCEGGSSIGLVCSYGGLAELKRVRNVRVSGDCAGTIGIFAWAARLQLIDVEIRSTDWGVQLIHSSAALKGCDVETSGSGSMAIELQGDQYDIGRFIDIQDSQIRGVSAGIYHTTGHPLTFKVRDSVLQGASAATFGVGTSFYAAGTQFIGGINSSLYGPADVFKTIGCYDTNFDPLVP